MTQNSKREVGPAIRKIPPTKTLGKRGEDLACAFLEQNGCRILVRNFRSRQGEIDIIAKEGETLLFVEVKTRQDRVWGVPEEAVRGYKQKKIIHTALVYLKGREVLCRFDVVAVEIEKEKDPVVRWIKGAFDAF